MNLGPILSTKWLSKLSELFTSTTFPIAMNIQHNAGGASSLGSTTAYKIHPVTLLDGDVFGSIVGGDRVSIPAGNYIYMNSLLTLGDADGGSFGLFNFTQSTFIFDRLVNNGPGASPHARSGNINHKFTVTEQTELQFQTKVQNANGSNEIIYDGLLIKLN